MKVVRFNSFADLRPHSQAWDRLAASVPFRRWVWLSTWWKHYGEDSGTRRGRRELFVLAVFDKDQELVGIAPWFIENRAAFGDQVRMLGSGEICSDYLTLLCSPNREEDIAAAVAEYLMNMLSGDRLGRRRWSQIELFGVDRDDRATACLSDSLRSRHCTVHRRSTINCWRIDLPGDWERYLAGLSGHFRQELRRLERKYLLSNKAVPRNIERSADLSSSLDILIDLHQRRRQALGESGCYASRRFDNFIRDVSPLLLERGQMQIQWIEIDGSPVAADFELLDGEVVYIYQTGIAPEAASHNPGKLMNIAGIRRAIENGRLSYDFLRGDEPYKARFGASPRPSMQIRIIPNQPGAQLRHTLWLTGLNVKRWLKNGRKTAEKQIS